MADGWRVVNQRQAPIEGAGGMMQQGLIVEYETDDGTVHGHVQLPLAQLSPDVVKQAIAAQVSLHTAIANL